LKTYIADSADPKAEIVTGDVTKWKSAPSMTIFSSRGPNVVALDIIKPDITAPGHQILAGNSPNNDGNVQGELFMSIAGTSMSSPHVAGVFALIKEAHPDWSAAAAKSAIMTSADPDVVDNDRSTQATPFEMGAGQVDPGGDRKNSAFQPGLVYDAGFFEYLGFLCDAEPSALGAGTCPFLDSIGVPIEAEDLNLASIGVSSVPGTETITRTVTNVSSSTIDVTAKVGKPSGYDVSVSPSTLSVAPGGTATFEVTFTNMSAPVGVWRFGSLTWQGDGYKVRSPIAVRASSLATPNLVGGSGAAGTASFDVGFGYTGPYTAASHGLAADAPTSDDIGQDPDQTYPSGDDTPVGVQKIDFTVTGSLLVRWSLVIPGPDDIDLFLENSGGTIIAASTNGGTDELIELVLPADDTYTMVVHGWSVPNAPLPYTLSFWDVPLAGGGSLTVTSAPASATIGTTGTVDLSWTGAAAGLNLGVVSHDDGTGIVAITLVEIAN
jgi:hypothetical protein